MKGLLLATTLSTILQVLPYWVIAQPEAPIGLTAKAYDSHIELDWAANPEPNVRRYKIYCAEGTDTTFQLLKTVNSFPTTYIDFVGRRNVTKNYRITAENNVLQESLPSASTSATTFEMTDDELLTMVQEYTFRYFWDFGHPVSGLARERNSTSTVTMGGSGFGVMAILVGIERGFISREAGLARLNKIVNFLTTADRFHGVFPHWMNGANGRVIPFSERDNGGDLVETAFLMQGLLTVRQYFSQANPEEEALRERITQLWEAVEWDWHLRNGVLLWHWSPNFSFQINLPIRGYNEALIVYLLAIASPTHSIPANVYYTGWAGSNYTNGNAIYGYKLDVGALTGGPLFFAHYSYMGFDPRGIKDRYANYFRHNINHTLINRAYCIANPGRYKGYSEVCWGLTASDDPVRGYWAHTANPNFDNGTLTPTAALSSMPYTPEESLAALKHFYRALGAKLWGVYGFYDAFNLSLNWYADSYLAIDQGPIINMIENYRSELLWQTFMTNPEIQPALDAIGFEPDSSVVSSTKQIEQLNFIISPNPVNKRLAIQWDQTKQYKQVQVKILSLYGTVVQAFQTSISNNSIVFDISELDNGIYILSLSDNEHGVILGSQKIVISN